MLKRMIILLTALVMLAGTAGSAFADPNRTEVAETFSNYCLSLALAYMDIYAAGNKQDEILIASYHYYRAYLEMKNVNTVESGLAAGLSGDYLKSSILREISSGMNEKMKDAYIQWLNGDTSVLPSLYSSLKAALEVIRRTNELKEEKPEKLY